MVRIESLYVQIKNKERNLEWMHKTRSQLERHSYEDKRLVQCTLAWLMGKLGSTCLFVLPSKKSVLHRQIMLPFLAKKDMINKFTTTTPSEEFWTKKKRRVHKHTCYRENNTTEGNPCFLLVPNEVIYDAFGIDCFDHKRVVTYDIVQSYTSYENEPNTQYQSKHVANFISSKSLNHEKEYQDSNRCPNNSICLQKLRKNEKMYVYMLICYTSYVRNIFEEASYLLWLNL